MATTLPDNNKINKESFSLKTRLLRSAMIVISKSLKQEIMKNIVKLRLIRNYYYDFRRFFQWSSVNYKVIDTQTKLRALITMDYHRLEKGLALKQPKTGFGSDVIERLSKYLPDYINKYGIDETILITVNALQEYYDFNLKNGLDTEIVKKTIGEVKNQISNQDLDYKQGGTITVTRNSIWQSGKIDLKDFFNSRHSIREFSSQEVAMEEIEKAVKMAQKTPSVCNRQSCKVYMFSDEESKRKVLSYQNGNRGFGDQASKVLIVTSNLEHFTSIGERNQGWIDGGMFSMSLVYALHSLGLGTCCLNWSVTHYQDKLLKLEAGIPDSELVMMMIAVGHLPETLRVAQSPRKPLQEVLIIK
jgi:nitroreductase